VPVIVGLDGNELNLSPLRGNPGARFVTTSKEMADALQLAGIEEALTDSERSDFFFLDPDLPRWKLLLAQADRE
jgi:surface carbohydrate biosynthesis protein (TIGR04326 family)